MFLKLSVKKEWSNLLNDFDLVEIRKKRNEDLSIGQRRRVYKLHVNLCMIWNYYF